MKNNYLTLLKESSSNSSKSTHLKVTKRAFTTLLSLLFVGFTYAQSPAFPVDFEDGTATYFDNFGRNDAKVIVDPTDATNKVAESTKQAGSEVWGGSTIVNAGVKKTINFRPGSTKISVRVWSPEAGAIIKMKVENLDDGSINKEVDITTTAVKDWETMTFDFDGIVEFDKVYNKLVLFCNFGKVGTGDKTFYYDDITFIEAATKSQVDLPVTFDSEFVDYTLSDFGNNQSKVIEDPTDASNMVAETIKPANAETWAGTTIGNADALATAIPFSATETKMTIRVWSPDSGIVVRFKVEDKDDDTKTCETEAITSKSSVWETLTFDFSKEADGTAKLDTATAYTKASIFFNFNVSGATAGEKTYYWDDVMMKEKKQADLPFTFEDPEVDYILSSFPDVVKVAVIKDPTDATNKVGEFVKPLGAPEWAGVTCGDARGFVNAIPFAATETKMTVRVWSPDSGIVIRLKVEDKDDATKSCETDATTTTASVWETLEFDFNNEATGTAKFDLANTYDKASLFFNKGVTGDEAGEKTYYFDDLKFGEKPASAFITAKLGLKYFPNPVNDVLTIVSDFTMDQVTVFNQLGQIVLTHSANVSNTSLDMTSLPTGIYMVRVEADNKAETFKITK